MKWYKPIECDKTVKNPLVCDCTNFEEFGFNKWDFVEGKAINNWNDNIFFKAREEEDDGDPDDALQNSKMIPIFSPRLIKALIDENIQGIQYLPIKVIRPNNQVIEGFNIANFLNFIEAFDYENSEYDKFEDKDLYPDKLGKISAISFYVLKEKKLMGYNVIRLAEYRLRFFVSEKFKKIFEKNKFTGYSFKKVELS